ncbi:MAG: hypothetical protein ACKO0Z_23470, partial [Betaproteobacteria bacterium]
MTNSNTEHPDYQAPAMKPDAAAAPQESQEGVSASSAKPRGRKLRTPFRRRRSDASEVSESGDVVPA